MITSEPTPTNSVEQENGANRSTSLAAHRRMKILVIDDEPLNVALLEDMLAGSGYTRVQSITDSRLTQRTCESFAPDLVLLDLMMPFIDGFTVLEGMRSASREIFLPVI